MKNIILIGFMGTGKSTIANKLSKLLSFKVVDTDKYISKMENMSITQIFEQKGEEYFRMLETKLLTNLQPQHSLIISCGGGTPLNPKNQILLKNLGCVFLLNTSAKTIFYRVKHSKDRPLLNDNMNLEYISNMIEGRKEKYLMCCDFVIKTDNKSLISICNEIKNKYNT